MRLFLLSGLGKLDSAQRSELDSGCCRFRGGGPGRPGGRGYQEEYGGQEEGFEGSEEMSRGWDSGGRGRPPRGGGPPRGGERIQKWFLFWEPVLDRLRKTDPGFPGIREPAEKA